MDFMTLQTTNHLSELLQIQRDPELKEWLDAVRVESCKKIYRYLDAILPEEKSDTPCSLLDAEGKVTFATPRVWDHHIPRIGARFILMGARIHESGGLQIADDSITAYLRTPAHEIDNGDGDWPISRNTNSMLFTATEVGGLYGPVSDLTVVEDILAEEMWQV